MRRIFTLLTMGLLALNSTAQTELTQTEAKTLYKTTSKRWISVHDPSVVWEPNSKRYYIFGSHRAQAWTQDLQNWTWFSSPWKVGSNNNASNTDAFVTPKVTKVTKGGQEVDFPAFNAYEWAAAYPSWRDGNGNPWHINGNMWAPDVIWNPSMQKWCQYLSINGPKWNSSIILLTSDNIEGPYEYQGPVVISGFGLNANTDYKKTDLELVLGPQPSLPTRYSGTWASITKPSFPNNIDPCVFYDEEGKLWMAYGSWSGGIFILELNEQTGLRDYDVEYENSDTSDAYFGKKIAGGYYSSGEAPYIEYIGGYYYLFVTYGELQQNGDYNMRVYRSENPDGPYSDPGKRSPIYSSYVLNFGNNAPARGEKLLGPYSHWGYMSQGERSQGHNSIIAAPDGRTYLVYHTRFCNDNKDGDEGHQVRVHQVFQTQDGWLVAAPFEYNGEQTTDQDIATKQPFTQEEMVGTYNLLMHKFTNNRTQLEQVEPVTVNLNADSTVTGKYTGTWRMTEGTSYITLTLNKIEYQGVVVEETMDNQSLHALAITACGTTGANIWAYKLMPKYELAWMLNNMTVPVKQNQYVSKDVYLHNIGCTSPNSVLSWQSEQPEVISEYGKYNPSGLTQDTPLTLTARLDVANYFWTQNYKVYANKESIPTANWQGSMLAHYGFDHSQLSNSFDATQEATLGKNGSGTKPALEDGDPMRTGRVVHTFPSVNKSESYVAVPNPLYGKNLENGAAISVWVNRSNSNLYGTLLGAIDGAARLFFTGNAYLGYNDGKTEDAGSEVWNNWVDLNHPDAIESKWLSENKWQLVTLSFAKDGIKLYVSGGQKTFSTANGKLKGVAISKVADFDYSLVLDHLSACQYLYLGNGGFWGSADARYDDLIVYDRSLSFAEALALNTMENRVFDFWTLNPTGIADMTQQPAQQATTVYDLQGRAIKNGKSLDSNLPRGLYIINGRKVVVK
ncbi:family 43 glycosylhydrolase [Xylanibacter brevis]|uniref:family 43 glycosylhydrolase n=1 Tax=Xylanibacter brevis TaxID=83231 RepID=UPI00047F17B1|nr:family 43 glycosylhydrolase [Xylanibacter brevis]